jgi:hypothetical protein
MFVKSVKQRFYNYHPQCFFRNNADCTLQHFSSSMCLGSGVPLIQVMWATVVFFNCKAGARVSLFLESSARVRGIWVQLERFKGKSPLTKDKDKKATLVLKISVGDP